MFETTGTWTVPYAPGASWRLGPGTASTSPLFVDGKETGQPNESPIEATLVVIPPVTTASGSALTVEPDRTVPPTTPSAASETGPLAVMFPTVAPLARVTPCPGLAVWESDAKDGGIPRIFAPVRMDTESPPPTPRLWMT